MKLENCEIYYCPACRATFAPSDVDEYIVTSVKHHGHKHAFCPGITDAGCIATFDDVHGATDMCSEKED